MVLTPQLRQRIEMLQMTTLELSELIQAELDENPILEEVENGDEILELAEKILDQNADGSEGEFDSADAPTDSSSLDADDGSTADPSENGHNDDLAENTKEAIEEAIDAEDSEEPSDAFDEVDLGREFQDYLDPGYRTQEFEFKEDAPSLPP